MLGRLSIVQSAGSLQIIDIENTLSPDHILALNLMGFSEQDDGGYGYDSASTDLIIAVSEYLQGKGYELVSDSITDSILKARGKAKLEYKESQNMGIDVKKQTHFKPVVPPRFKHSVQIKPYQLKSITHMLNVHHAANFSVPGSGKTLMTYAVYDILKSTGAVDGLLVVGPLSSFAPWEDECNFCMQQPSPSIFRYLGPDRKNYLDSLPTHEIVLTTYGTASNDVDYLRNHLLSKKNIMMVIDESHHIKKFSEDAKFSEQMIRLGETAKRRYILSGTPVPRSLEDLWSQITFLWPHNKILGSRSAYAQLLNQNASHETIYSLINFLWTRVTNRQLKADLPPILEQSVIPVPMSSHQEEIYTSIELDMLRIEKNQTNILDFSQFRRNRMLRLLQAVTNPRVLLLKDSDHGLDKFYTGDGGLDQLVETYSETSPKIQLAANLAVKLACQNHNVVVWTLFVANVELLRKAIHDVDPTQDTIGITGKIPLDSDDQKDIRGREALIREFKSGTRKIMVATVGSIAESISLHHSCQRAIYLERGFNAGQYMQSLSRIYRIGSDKIKPVQFTFLESVFGDGKTETIDHKIDVVLKDRIRQLHDLLDDEFVLHPLDLETGTRQSLMDVSGNDDARKIYADLLVSAKNHGVGAQ